MPIDDDAWDAPVPEAQEEQPAASPPRASRSRPQRPLLIGGAVVAVIVVVVAVIALSGGGSGGLSKSAWIQKANAICGSIATQQATDSNNSNISGLAAVTQDAISRIRGLGLPNQDGAQAQSVVSAYQHGEDVLEQAVASQNNDPSGAQGLVQQALSAFNSANTAAGRFGLQVCAGS
jgi:hypothetical protein